MTSNERVTEDRAKSLGPNVSQLGFTLPEILISLVVLSIVGLGAYTVMQSTIDAQIKLERAVEKGFGSFNYKPRNLPLQPLKLGFKVRPGWFRIPSPHAILPNGKVEGDLVNTTLTMTILSDDARLENPVWVKCESDKEVNVQCGKFENGIAMVSFKLTERTSGIAIARVQAEWPSLPVNHPYKRSPEYILTTPLARDCGLVTETKDAPKYLRHGNIFMETVPPGSTMCTVNFKIYRCLNGTVTVNDHQRVCQ